MSKKTMKLMSASVLVACAFGLIALRVASATPGQGITSTPIVGPVLFDEINTKSKTDDHEVKIRTKGLSDVYVTHLKLVSGGHGGWHSHPGPSIISVLSGEATFYQADDPQTPHVYPEGTGFVEDAGLVHTVVNEGDVDLEIIVMQIIPTGAPRRIDAPHP